MADAKPVEFGHRNVTGKHEERVSWRCPACNTKHWTNEPCPCAGNKEEGGE